MDTLIFALLYQLLSFPIFLLVLDRGLKAALAASGYSYLTAENLAEFLLEPWTAVFLILLVLFGVLLMSVEAGAFLTAYQGTAYFRRVTPLGMGLGGLEKTADEGKKRNGKVFLVIMPMETILEAGKAVNANIDSVFTFVLIAVAPFNLVKGVVVSLVTLVLYKYISRLLKGGLM